MSESVSAKQFWVSARVVALYHANVSALDWAGEMQARVGSSWETPYLREKLDDYSLGFHHLFPTLDRGRQEIHCDIMWDRYGEEALHEWEMSR